MRYLLIVLMLFAAVPASAQSLTPPTIVFLGSAAADIGTTAYCLRSKYCYESNPLMAPIGRATNNTVMLTSGVAIDVVSVWLWNRSIGKTHPKWAAVGLYAFSALRFTIAARNLKASHDARSHGTAPIVTEWCNGREIVC